MSTNFLVNARSGLLCAIGAAYLTKFGLEGSSYHPGFGYIVFILAVAGLVVSLQVAKRNGFRVSKRDLEGWDVVFCLSFILIGIVAVIVSLPATVLPT